MRAVAALCLLVVGCSSTYVTEVDLTQDGRREVAFFAVLDEARAIVRTTTPLVLEADGTSRGAARTLTLEAGESEVVLVRFGFDALAPGFLTDRLDALEIRIAPPPADRTRRLAVDGTVLVDAPLPAATELSRVELRSASSLAPLGTEDRSATSVRTGLTLTTPIDPEHCRNPQAESLRPFGATAQLSVPNDPGFHTFRWVVHVAPDVLLVGTGPALYVLERGGTIEAPPHVPGTPGPWLPLDSLAPEPEGLFNAGLAVDPTTEGQSSRRVVIAAATEYEPDRFRSYVFELTYRDGTLGEVVTSTVFEERARNLAFAEDGSYAVVGDQGLFLLFDRGSIRSYPLPPPIGIVDESRQVLATRDPEYPWISGTRNRLNRLSLARDGWSTQVITPPSQESLHFAGLASVTEGGATRAWALGNPGLFLALEEGTWVDHPLIMPPAFGPCSPSGNVAAPEIVGPMESMARGGGHLYMAHKGCTAFLAVRQSDLCVSMARVEGRPIEMVEDFVEALEVFRGELVAVGQGGVVYAGRIED